MPFYLVKMASGGIVVVDAHSDTDAKVRALQEASRSDSREEVLDVVYMEVVQET